jgi:cytochrome c oxidase cbb3-type subunit I/II
MIAINAFMTWRQRPDKYEPQTAQAAPLSKDYADRKAVSRLPASFPPAAHKIDRMKQALWHRKWERLPLFFTVVTLTGVVIGSLAEAIPMFLIKSNVASIKTVHPYTPLELAGRDIYVAEGCYNCHSQMIRPMLAETERYGDYSMPGEFVYDRPFQWGSRRIGPDLAREGITNPSAPWHYRHFKDPRVINENSLMPSYPWLLEQEVAFDEIQGRVDAMAMLGTPYGELVEAGNAEIHARHQAAQIAATIEAEEGIPASETETKKVVALIAYIQRLGVDIYRDPDAPSPLEMPAVVEDGISDEPVATVSDAGPLSTKEATDAHE